MSSELAQQARGDIAGLRELISKLLQSNPGFAEHTTTYTPPTAEEQIASSSRSKSSVRTESSARHILPSSAFESILGTARVYRRADRNDSTNSFKTIHSSWSQLSGLTLADISDLSVICLPVYASELSNAYLYRPEPERPKTTGISGMMVSGRQLERVRQASGRIRTGVWYRSRIAKGVKGAALFHEAAGKGYVEVVRTMLQNGEVHENVTDSLGATAVHHSALNGHMPILRLLLEQGANIDAATTDGGTALHHSALRGDHDIVLLLLDGGANMYAAAEDGKTALHYSAVRGHTSIVQLLLDRGANIDDAVSDGKTALHYSAAKRYTSTIQLLLDRGANIDAAAKDGQTALHYSAVSILRPSSSCLTGAPTSTLLPKTARQRCTIRQSGGILP